MEFNGLLNGFNGVAFVKDCNSWKSVRSENWDSKRVVAAMSTKVSIEVTRQGLRRHVMQGMFE